jgi:hypothetical protein
MSEKSRYAVCIKPYHNQSINFHVDLLDILPISLSSDSKSSLIWLKSKRGIPWYFIKDRVEIFELLPLPNEIFFDDYFKEIT